MYLGASLPQQHLFNKVIPDLLRAPGIGNSVFFRRLAAFAQTVEVKVLEQIAKSAQVFVFRFGFRRRFGLRGANRSACHDLIGDVDRQLHSYGERNRIAGSRI